MLVGDAADFFDPFTGEGIFSALRGGELLAPFAAAALEAHARGRGAHEIETLRDYEKARSRVFAGKWRVERIIGTAVSSPRLMNLAARALGLDRALSDLLIGVTGDFVPASVILKPRSLRRIAAGLVRACLSKSPADARVGASPLPSANSSSAPISGHVHRS